MAGRFGKFTEAQTEAGTDTGTGKGNKKLHASSGIVEARGPHGQSVKRAFPLDTSDMQLCNEQGLDGFAGSPSNISHSLKGASAVQRNEPTKGKRSGWTWPNH